MSPRKFPLRPATHAEGVTRRRICEQYLEVAEIAAMDEGAAINVAVGVAVLAGIAASDAVCIAATGERYSGQDHAAAVTVLRRVDKRLGDRLKVLVDLKAASHYGDSLLTVTDRERALRAARTLVGAARERI